jgi:Kelch motif
MSGRGPKLLAGLAIAMTAVLAFGILAAGDVVDLPGNWRTTLGFEDGAPDNPCRLGLYRKSPQSPPPGPGRWRMEREAPRAQVEGSAIAIGPRIYVAGGSAPGNLSRFLVYDTRSGRWSEPGSLPAGLNHSQATTYDGDLYLAGGYLGGMQATSNFWRYDTQAKRWEQLPPMSQPRGAAAAAVLGHRLYVAGGGPQMYGADEATRPYDSLEIYDFDSNRWSSGPDAPLALHHVNGAALGGKLYIAGGRVDVERSSDAFLSYDPRPERWRRLPPLPIGPMSSLGVVAAAGKVVIVCGDDEEGWEDGGGSVTPTAWAFDPRRGRWQRLPDLAVERHAHGTAVSRGRIYAIAGAICPGIKPSGPVGTHTVESLPVSALRARPAQG